MQKNSILEQKRYASAFALYDIAKMDDFFRLTWKLNKILFHSQLFASWNMYYLKPYASTECLK